MVLSSSESSVALPGCEAILFFYYPSFLSVMTSASELTEGPGVGVCLVTTTQRHGSWVCKLRICFCIHTVSMSEVIAQTSGWK